MSRDVIFKKEINYSLLTSGITISRDTTDLLGYYKGSYLLPGMQKDVVLIIEGKPYNAIVKNVKFNDKNRMIHKNDAIQLRYNKDVAVVLQAIFHKSFKFFLEERSKLSNGQRKNFILPFDAKEYFVLSSTAKEDVYEVTALLAENYNDMKEIITKYPEQQLEHILNYTEEYIDPNATIEERLTLQKFRKIDKKIGEHLKELYGYRCQICGKVVGDRYGTAICEAHHIKYFSKSLNNDMSNQMIVCPNHHSIIHKTNPEFKFSKLVFEYKNGLIEPLVINKHLNK